MVLTAAGIVLSLLSASATMLEISPAHNFADEQEISATVAPEIEIEQIQGPQTQQRTLDFGVTSVDDDAPLEPPVNDDIPPEPHPCDGEELIAFAGFAHGTILAEQYAAAGVHISAVAPDDRPDAVVIFDSGASGTSAPDLEIDIGNLAVIAEDVADEDGDGLVDTPGNGYGGGTQVYTFDQDREVLYIVYVEVDTLSLQGVKAFDAGGAEIAISLTLTGDGSVQTIEVGAQGVRRLEVTYGGSGAIAEICLDALSQ